MFEHYEENARRTIFFARYDAAQLRCSEIGPEHIFLGLLRDSTLTNGALANIPVQGVRSEILKHLQRGEKKTPPEHLPFSVDSQSALALARKEAEVLHQKLNNHHILLGLMLLENNFVSQALKRDGVSVTQVRKQLLNLPRRGETQQAVSHKPANRHPYGPPADQELYELERSAIQLLELNDYKAVLKLVDDAIANPRLDRNQTVRLLTPIASAVSRTMGDFALMKYYCELLLSCDPYDPRALYTLANCLVLQGKTEAAKEIARKSYQLSLAKGGIHGDGLTELIEQRFPDVKSQV